MDIRPVRPPGLLGNLTGGLTAALVQIPVESAYGMLALAPLGPQFASVGILSGLYSAAISNAVAALAGSRLLLGGPRTSLTLMVAATCAMLASHPAFRSGSQIDVSKVLAFLSLGLLMAGLLQVAIGALRWGSLAKFIPYPVHAGLMAGVGLLLIGSALRPMLGLSDAIPWRDAPGLLTRENAGALAVAGLVVVMMLRSPRAIPLPPPLIALLAGIALFHGLAAVIGVQAGPAMVAIPIPALDLTIPKAWVGLLSDPELVDHWALLMPFVLTVALLGTLESLLAASQMDGATGIRRDSNREAMAQGWSNVVGSVFGAQPSGGAVPRTMICHESGGRSQSSVYFYSLFIATAVLVAPRFLELIPMSAVAAVIAVSGLKLIDDWCRRVPRLLLTRGELAPGQRGVLAENYALMLMVAGTMVIGSIGNAVVLGLIVSMVLFVRSNARSVVRSVVRGDSRRSIKVREPQATAQLTRDGRRIALLTLEGALFFGTADQLAARVQELPVDVDFVVLDLKRLTEIDPTGARILHETARSLAALGKRLVLCELGWSTGDARMLAIESMSPVPSRQAFSYQPDVDRALEWAEDRVLEEAGLPVVPRRPLALVDTVLGRGLAPAELAFLSGLMSEVGYEAGQYIFRAGDPGDALYLSTIGEISILLPAAGDGRGKRLVSFAPGVVFGEMAVLEGGVRSADAVAEADLSVLRLSKEDFERLRLEEPVLAGKVLLNLGIYLSARMRSMTGELSTALSG